MFEPYFEQFFSDFYLDGFFIFDFKIIQYFFLFFESFGGLVSFYGSTGTHVLDFWWQLLHSIFLTQRSALDVRQHSYALPLFCCFGNIA